jgi:hypothetical protein
MYLSVFVLFCGGWKTLLFRKGKADIPSTLRTINELFFCPVFFRTMAPSLVSYMWGNAIIHKIPSGRRARRPRPAPRRLL